MTHLIHRSYVSQLWWTLISSRKETNTKIYESESLGTFTKRHVRGIFAYFVRGDFPPCAAHRSVLRWIMDSWKEKERRDRFSLGKIIPAKNGRPPFFWPIFFFHERPGRSVIFVRGRPRSFIRPELIGNFVAVVYRVALPKTLCSLDGI